MNREVLDHDPVAQLLQESRDGNRISSERLARLVFDDLRRLARRKLHGYSCETMDTIGLVGEAYIRIIEKSRYRLNDRKHFFAVAAQIMRQILCDSARRRISIKRGGQQNRVELVEESAEETADATQLVELDVALSALEKKNESWARLVEMKYFAGAGEVEIAEALDMSLRQTQREWAAAKLWLRQYVGQTRNSPAQS